MSTGPRSVSVIDTSDVVVEARPTATIAIGLGTYTVTAPKTDVWRETTKILAFAERGEELRAAGDLSEEELLQLEAIAVNVGEMEHLVKAIITGTIVYDEDGDPVLQGGFVRHCLSTEDWTAVKREWRDPASDVDSNYLLAIANKLQKHFAPWFEARGEATGLPEVEVPAKRKTPKSSPKTAG